MRRILTMTLAAFIASAAFGQSALPAGTSPFIGEISVRYMPSYESRCTEKTSEKTPGQLFGTEKVTVATFGVQQVSPRVLKLYMATDWDGSPMRVSIGINEDGTNFLSDDVDIETSTPMSDEDVLLTKKIFGNLLKDAFGIGLQPPLRMGTNRTKSDICEIVPGGKTLTKNGRYVIIGTAELNGRSSIVYSGEQTFSCRFDGKDVAMRFRGWEAIDRQSGLPAGGSSHMVVSMNGSDSATATSDQVCIISGPPARVPKATTPTSSDVKTLEQRLTELKGLSDKGLISSDQYEKRSTEIINEF